MKCSEIIEVLGRLAPEGCACEWDNPGLLAGRSGKEVRNIYIALDATDQVVEAAIGAGADMLLTHHPLIFKAIKKVNDQDFITRRLVKLIQADISYYAMHTNFDAAPGCMADLAAERLGLTECVPLEAMGEIEGAIASGSQVLVTGDISHHQGIDAAARNIAVIDGGHYGLEHIFIPYMADYLAARLGDGVNVIQAPPSWPTVII